MMALWPNLACSQFCKYSFTGMCPCSFIYFSVAIVALQRQSWIVVTENTWTTWPWKHNILTVWPFTKMIVDPRSNALRFDPWGGQRFGRMHSWVFNKSPLAPIPVPHHCTYASGLVGLGSCEAQGKGHLTCVLRPAQHELWWVRRAAQGHE